MKTSKPLSLPGHRPRSSGFTLIELLVVIAIIAILAAILFPVFAKAREKARQAACLNNEKQIGTALLQYEQDYDEALPYFWFGPNNNASRPDGTYYKWMDAVFPYVKSEQVFNCPDDTGQYNYTYYKNLPAAGSDAHYGSYGINAMYRYDTGTGGLTRTPPAGRYLVGLTISQIANPAGTVWIGDITSGPGNDYFGWSCLASGSGCTSLQPANVVTTSVNPNQIDKLVARHTDRTDIIFCDGHAKAVTLNSLASDRAKDGLTLKDFTIEDD